MVRLGSGGRSEARNIAAGRVGGGADTPMHSAVDDV